MPRENGESQRWVKHKRPDGSRVFRSRVFGEGETGTITILASGKVSVEVSGRAFEEQKAKVISRFKKTNAGLLAKLETALYTPSDALPSQLLREIIELRDQVSFDRRLDVLVSTLRAVRELRSNHYLTRTGKRFIATLQALVARNKRPPTKREITAQLNCSPQQTTKWCQEHGFGWLETEHPGRRD